MALEDWPRKSQEQRDRRTTRFTNGFCELIDLLNSNNIPFKANDWNYVFYINKEIICYSSKKTIKFLGYNKEYVFSKKLNLQNFILNWWKSKTINS